MKAIIHKANYDSEQESELITALADGIEAFDVSIREQIAQQERLRAWRLSLLAKYKMTE